jgi:hypothetical protein
MGKKKYKQVKVNLHPEDYEKMQKLAEQYDTTIASLFRELADMQIDKPRKPRGGKKEGAVDYAILYELNKIGNNINQIAKYANTHKSLDRTILALLSSIEDKLKTML